jgi:hypothetical protein
MPSVDEAAVVELYATAAKVDVSTDAGLANTANVNVSAVAEVLVILIDFTIVDVELGTV